jgi:ADP-dependent NAD(P)H-hydrate dehydratase / NAD(P)H-hydrate epimerase
MMDYWQKQSSDKPLYDDLLWSRPETRKARGKLLIIGGNSFGFAAVNETFVHGMKAGIGESRALLPEAVRKVVGNIFEQAEFGASNPSGGFSQQALGEWLEQAMWADGVIMPGDFGRNSETAIVTENFIKKYSGQLTVARDALDYFKDTPQLLFERPEHQQSFARLRSCRN